MLRAVVQLILAVAPCAVAGASRSMELSSLTPKTVDQDPAAQPSAQIFIDGQGTVWHDLDHIFQALRKNGLQRGKQPWRKDVRKYWVRQGVPASLYLLRGVDADLSLRSNVCTTSAFYHMLWGHFVYGRETGRLHSFIHRRAGAYSAFAHPRTFV